LPKEVEQLMGDRNGQLEAFERKKKMGRCIDNPTTLPALGPNAAQILQGKVERYIFISTISSMPTPVRAQMKHGPLAKYEGADPVQGTLRSDEGVGLQNLRTA